MFCVLFFLALNVEAAKRYWVAASDANTNWHDPANWSNTNGGSGGKSVPIWSDKAYFTNKSTVNATISNNAKTKRLQTGQNYTGTISLDNNVELLSRKGVFIFGGTVEVPLGSTLWTKKGNSKIGTKGTIDAKDGTLKFGKNLTAY